MDVGQGDACLLTTPSGRRILYDAGNQAQALTRFLASRGVDTLHELIISHADLDHFGASRTLLAEFPVSRVRLPLVERARQPDSAWLALLRDLDERGIPKDTLYAGDTAFWDESLRVTALWPPRHGALSDNELSQVLRVEHAGGAILLTGDIEAAAETGLLAARVPLSADILKVPHHGSRTSSSLPFLASVSPRWAVISCDSAVYGHPHRETVEGLRRIIGDGGRVLRTDREGTVGFELGGRGVKRIGIS